MKQQAQNLTTIAIKLLALTLIISACTKTRQAALPEDTEATIFSIAEVEVEAASINTDDQLKSLTTGDFSKATAEKGIVAVSDVEVSERLKFMFRGLEISGQAGKKYPIAISVDRQFVTAYKIVSDTSELSIIEKELALVKDEVVLQKQLQKTKNTAQVKSLVATLQKTRDSKQLLMSRKANNVYVPLFKFKINAYGVIEKKRNELKEETSTLQLKPTDWAEATHIQISVNSADRLNVGLDPSTREEMNRTFVMDRINNKIMTAETLKSDYQIPINLKNETRILTLLDVDSLHIYEIGTLEQLDLTDSQIEQLKSGAANSNVRNCSAEIVKALPVDAQKNCVLILRYDLDISYVRPELPAVDNDGNRAANMQFKTVRAGQNVGLVQIAAAAQPKRIESNNELDPRTSIRIFDIKDKEFFFKRTIEDAAFATSSAGLAPGMAGAIAIVKFELEEKRIVLRKVDKIVNYKTSTNSSDFEEVMSLPVKYLKLETHDASGAAYSKPRLVAASRKDAQYIELDWTANTIPQRMSPYAAIYDGCINGIADSQVVDVDMRLDKGVLNFSQKYSVGLDSECIADFNPVNAYNAAPTYQATARIKERISLKLNDKSTDTPFVPQIPFKAQNAMGYGVWTLGQINPNSQGQMGREGQEANYPMVHDFRNGKVLVYTITGLPTDDSKLRETYVGIVQELVAAWNLAYKQAFKGSALERSGDYIQMQIAGENGVQAHLGDLDKNIFHIENKFADHGVLGVSQVGFNPRSAIVVADSLILYGGNVKQDVYRSFTQMKNRVVWTKKKEDFKKAAIAAASSGKIGNPDKASITAPEKAADTSKRSLRINDLNNLVKSRGPIARESFKYSSPTSEYGWMDRAFRKSIATPNATVSEIEGILAKEFLASKGTTLTEVERRQISRLVKSSEMRAKLMASLHNSPGCMKTSAEVTNDSFEKLNFDEAFRIEALNTMVHEMGHSQGLTHNFIGSYDKANFKNEDGSESKRNYSSVMDYLTPGHFSWDGLGTYDIHAVRAAHLGLLKTSDGSFIHVNTIQEKYAKNGWANFKRGDVSSILKPYKYCTDVHVGYDVVCERHDFGTSAVEIVESLEQDFENNYISNYSSWNRLNFDLSSSFRAHGASQYYMLRMRKFLDETFYLVITRNASKDEIQSHVNAALKSYLFFMTLIATPDTNESFLSESRFVAVPYQKKELNDQGKETGKVTNEITVAEKRSLENIAMRTDRLDTVGIESDKIAALNLLTLRGFPARKYESQEIMYSFFDFEKFMMELGTDQSLLIKLLTNIMLGKLEPVFTNNDVTLANIPSGKATVSATMRAYAGIYGILNLQTQSLNDKDNFANQFKVGSSVGQGPTDRIVLSQLGVSEESKIRVGFWALDNADAANNILSVAARKNFFIKKTPEIQPLMEELIKVQIKGADVSRVKESLLQKLEEINSKGEIISETQVKVNPMLSLKNQTDILVRFTQKRISLAIELAQKGDKTDEEKKKQADEISTTAEESILFAEELPLFAIAQNALDSTLGGTVGKFINPSHLETSYGLIMKNIEFLSMLTGMTNPEYNR